MHDNACGISISNSKIEKLHQIANKELIKYNFGETYYEVDFDLSANSTKLPVLISDLTKYESIWGQNNNEPLIHISDINVTWNEVDVVGKNQDTLRIHKNGITFIKFFAKEIIEQLKTYHNIKIEVVGKASMNEWGGRSLPQILIESIDFKENKIGDF